MGDLKGKAGPRGRVFSFNPAAYCRPPQWKCKRRPRPDRGCPCEVIPLGGMGKERSIMRFAKASRVLAAVLVLALTATALAATGAGTVTLSSAAQLNGKSLAAGEYKVRWDSHSPDADVTFLQGKATVASAHAKLVDGKETALEDSVVTRCNSDGSKSLLEVHFRGQKSFLVFE